MWLLLADWLASELDQEKVHFIIIIISAALFLCVAGWAIQEAGTTPMQWMEPHFDVENIQQDPEIAEVMQGNRVVVSFF